MAPDLEEQLRRHFAEDAADINAPTDLAMQVRRRARRQRSMAAALSAAAAVGVVAVGLWAGSGTSPDSGSGSGSSVGVAASPGAGPGASSAASPGAGRGDGRGVVSGQATTAGLATTGSAASCVRGFSPEALAEAGFAFDGTVVAIGDSATFDFERRVTFEVHHWYAGQSALSTAGSDQVDGSGGLLIDMPAPDGGGSATSEGLAYAVGERMLVSGAVRDGSGPAQGPVAWSCGFTGAYDTATARIWQDAFTANGG